MTQDALHAALKELAEKATPGPWRSHDHNSMAKFGDKPEDWLGYAWVGHGGNADGNFDAKIADLNAQKDGSPEWREQAHRNAAFIAAANPTAILGLIASLEEVKREANRAWRERNEAVARVKAWEGIVCLTDDDPLKAIKIGEWGPGEGDIINVRLPSPERLTNILHELRNIRQASKAIGDT